MDLNLTGKRALVTGSSSGIGAGIARLLASEGASVVVHGRNKERAEAVAASIVASGGKAIAVCGDLADEAQIDALAAGALAAFGGIDILVNNAGGSAETADKSWFGGTAATMAESYQANVIAAFCLIKLLSPAMKERGWGRIINISTAAAITPTSGQPDYGPAKAALINMS